MQKSKIPKNLNFDVHLKQHVALSNPHNSTTRHRVRGVFLFEYAQPAVRCCWQCQLFVGRTAAFFSRIQLGGHGDKIQVPFIKTTFFLIKMTAPLPHTLSQTHVFAAQMPLGIGRGLK